MTRSRIVGVLLMAALVFWAAALWRTRPPSRPAAGPSVVRGGEIAAAIRAEPSSFNPIASRDEAALLIGMLTQGTLVRINRNTFELEPWLAERWESSPDGRTYTLHLRDAAWSDGIPFTADDVLFSVRAALGAGSSDVHDALSVAGRSVQASTPDPHTVVLTLPGASGQGMRLFDSLVILPKHKLEAALNAGRFKDAWGAQTAPAEVVGTGPFVLRERQQGRLVFERNRRYWRKAPDGGSLPYLDRVALEVVPDVKTELMRLDSGAIDLTYGELPPDEYVTVRRAEEEGRLKVIELGVALSADALWFCLKPEAGKQDARFAFVQKREFRQAISHAVDREELAQKVYAGAAVPIWGPVTPGNRAWFWPDVPRYRPDLMRARQLLKGIALEDRDGNGVVEDAKGTEARFTVLTERGIDSYERVTRVLRDDLGRVGIAIDVMPIEHAALARRIQVCDYEAVYSGIWGGVGGQGSGVGSQGSGIGGLASSAARLDPAASMEMWLSAGSAHVWNSGQKAPASDWERRIDTLMLEQVATADVSRRRDQFNLVQRIFAENVPVLFFAAPRVYYAHTARVVGVTPSVLWPPALWSVETISAR